MSLRQSPEPFNGKEILLQSRSIEKEASGARVSRTISRMEAGGDRITHRQYTLGTQGQERLIMELTMTRKPQPAPAAR
jgi:hypothetical protein